MKVVNTGEIINNKQTTFLGNKGVHNTFQINALKKSVDSHYYIAVTRHDGNMLTFMKKMKKNKETKDVTWDRIRNSKDSRFNADPDQTPDGRRT